MSKPILFVDFDGTLCHDRFWRGLPKEQYDKVQEFLFGEDKILIHEWMKGKRTAEEINQQVSEELGIPFEEVWKTFVRDAETMSVSPEVLRQINGLRDKYLTILITVNMDCFSRFTVPTLKLESYFDVISNSYYEGRFKNDNEGEIFRDYLNKYSASISKSILVDDSASACETFRKIGGISYQVTPERDILGTLTAINNEKGPS